MSRLGMLRRSAHNPIGPSSAEDSVIFLGTARFGGSALQVRTALLSRIGERNLRARVPWVCSILGRCFSPDIGRLSSPTRPGTSLWQGLERSAAQTTPPRLVLLMEPPSSPTYHHPV